MCLKYYNNSGTVQIAVCTHVGWHVFLIVALRRSSCPDQETVSLQCVGKEPPSVPIFTCHTRLHMSSLFLYLSMSRTQTHNTHDCTHTTTTKHLNHVTWCSSLKFAEINITNSTFFESCFWFNFSNNDTYHNMPNMQASSVNLSYIYMAYFWYRNILYIQRTLSILVVYLRCQYSVHSFAYMPAATPLSCKLCWHVATAAAIHTVAFHNPEHPPVDSESTFSYRGKLLSSLPDALGLVFL